MNYIFKKNTDSALVTDKKISLDFCLNIKKMESSYLVDIPALQLFFYTKSESEIENEAQESLANFFNYWVKEREEKDFLDKMLNLGFTINRRSSTRNRTIQSKIPRGRKKKVKEELSL